MEKIKYIYTLHFLIGIFGAAHPVTFLQFLHEFIAKPDARIWCGTKGKYFPHGNTKCPNITLYTEGGITNGFY